MIYVLFGLMCLTILFVNSTPTSMLKDKFGLLEMKDEYSEFRNRIIELLNCCMCLGFWVGLLGLLLFSKSILISILGAAIVSIGSELINKLLRW